MEARMQFVTLDIIGVPKRSQLMQAFDSALEAIDMHPAGYQSHRDRDGDGFLVICSAEFGYISLRNFPQSERIFVDMLLPLSLKADSFVSRLKLGLPNCTVRDEKLWVRGAKTHREANEAFASIVSGGLQIPSEDEAW